MVNAAMVKIGVFLPFYAFGLNEEKYRSFVKLKKIALKCERLGYHSIWIDDHLMYADKPVLECWTTLSALASSTKTIKLGTLVLCNQFRNPALLAKMAATLDVISNGRLELGIGAGIQRQEHLAYGYAFPKLQTRAERLAEALEIIRQMWMKPEADFEGCYFKVKGAICHPKPLQKPYPPIIVGGCSPAILKVAAKYADRFDWGPMSLEGYKHKLSLLEAYTREAGRNPEKIEKACWPHSAIYLATDKEELSKKTRLWKPKGMSLKAFKKLYFMGTPEDLLETMQPYLELDVNFFMLYFGDLPSGDSLKIFAETILKKLRQP